MIKKVILLALFLSSSMAMADHSVQFQIVVPGNLSDTSGSGTVYTYPILSPFKTAFFDYVNHDSSKCVRQFIAEVPLIRHSVRIESLLSSYEDYTGETELSQKIATSFSAPSKNILLLHFSQHGIDVGLSDQNGTVNPTSWKSFDGECSLTKIEPQIEELIKDRIGEAARNRYYSEQLRKASK